MPFQNQSSRYLNVGNILLTDARISHEANGSRGWWMERRQLESFLPESLDSGARLEVRRATGQGIGKAAHHALRVSKRLLEGWLMEPFRRHSFVSYVVRRTLRPRTRASPSSSVPTARSGTLTRVQEWSCDAVTSLQIIDSSGESSHVKVPSLTS